MTGNVLTVNVTALDVTDGAHVPVITHLYWLLFMVDVAPVIVKVAVVTFEKIDPLIRFVNEPAPIFSCHWYDNPVPVATTLIVVLDNSQTVVFIGCVVIDGTVLTVSVA